MEFKDLNIYDEFSIESEPESLFYKLENRYDGAINTRQIKSKHDDDMFKPVRFSESFTVNKK